MSNKARKKSFFLGLRSKTVLTFAIPMLLTVGSFTWLARFRMREVLEQQLSKRLIGIAKTVNFIITAEWLSYLDPEDQSSRTYKYLRGKLSQLVSSTQSRRIYLFNRKGKIFLDSSGRNSKKSLELLVEPNIIERVFSGQTVSSVLFRDASGRWYKTGFAPIFDEQRGDRKPPVIAGVAVEGSADYFAQLDQLLREFFWYSILALLSIAITGILFSNWLLAPLSKLVQAAIKIGQGELTEEIRVSSRDEIGFLAQTMDEMRKNILARDQQMQMMLSGIAHEVRNPLGGIELFTGILKEELADRPEQLSHVERIQRELRYLADVVTSFLDYARPLKIQKEEGDLGEFVSQIVRLVEPEAEEKSVKIELQIEPLPKVYFDRQRLQQGLLNLIQNGIQASPENSTLTIALYNRGELVEISIRDRGPGIPEELREKIFQPFFTTKEKGTGLGLPLADKMVRAHGGTLSFSSKPNEETTFKITLPLTEK